MRWPWAPASVHKYSICSVGCHMSATYLIRLLLGLYRASKRRRERATKQARRGSEREMATNPATYSPSQSLERRRQQDQRKKIVLEADWTRTDGRSFHQCRPACLFFIPIPYTQIMPMRCLLSCLRDPNPIFQGKRGFWVIGSAFRWLTLVFIFPVCLYARNEAVYWITFSFNSQAR